MTLTQNLSADLLVGENIYTLMRRAGMTQAQLAGELGIQQASLSLKIRGKRPWYLRELQRAASVLDTDVAALVAMLPRLDSNQQPSGYASSLVRSRLCLAA